MNKPRKLNTKQKTAYDSLTRKQKAFVDHILNNPKDSATKAALAAYNTTSDNTASVIAHENLTKPNILAVLKDYSKEAEHTVIDVMHNSDNDNTRLSAANSLLDRVHGKAVQRSVSTTVSVEDIIDQLH